MAKEKSAPDSDEAAADEGMLSARSILERVTGEKMAKRSTQDRAKKGAAGRAAKLSPERRKEIAEKAATARWQK